MMNSTAGEDGGFPPNPFRSDSSQPQQQQQQAPDFYSTQTGAQAPAFAQPPMQQQQQQPVAQQQQYAPAAPMVYATPAPAQYTNPPSVPQGTMDNANTGIANAPQSRWAACVSCFRMETYLAYFDVDTADIQDRLKGSVMYFYKPDKFRSEVIGACRTETLKGPDLYGPLWVTMTFVFFLAVSSNLSAYIRADNMTEFEYDISHMVHAWTVCFGFSFGVPAFWWLVTQCMGMQALMMVDWICLYGYSMVPYLPATILCLVPWHPWIWICLTIATAMSGLLVVRNVAAPLLGADSQNNKAGPVLLGILASHVIFLLVLKIAFYE